jgi:RimJ/RimL family protein N-acetyltransferase
MTVSIPTGRFDLRPLRVPDATERYLGWLRDADFVAVSRKDQNIEDLQEFIRARENREDVLFLAIIDRRTKRHIGNIKYEPIDIAAGFAVMGILIGEPEFRGTGVAGEVLEATTAWLKAHLGIHTVVLGVSKNHSAAIRAYEKAGFVLKDTPLLVKSHPDQVLMVKRQ